ncbi:MAG TPA: hypothetical protein VM451_04395 [Candidatus Limnocylindria bacterium]|nr:hypothetical protein [Candidatus Limnocylindria bacterium]
MRSLIGFLVFTTALIALLAFAAVPMFVRPVVVQAVRDASPFGDQPLTIDVDVNALGLVLGRIERIHVTGADLDANGPTIGALDVTVEGASTTDRSFTGIDGAFSSVVLQSFDGTPVTIDSIDLSGESGAVEAVAHLDDRAGLALVGSAFADAGVPVEGLELADGGVAITFLGQRAQLALGVDQGALVLPDVLGTGPLTLLEPGIDDPWRLTGVTVTPTGMTILARIDADGLLASS